MDINADNLLRELKSKWLRRLSGHNCLLAVSGGLDSMTLAHLCLRAGIKFGVAHCNFGLRGDESDADEALVAAWCAENKAAFHVARFDTRGKAAEWKKGTQETARDLRYAWFEQVRKEQGYSVIATAHHANDNVETLLMNLCRGTGIAGMHGMLPENGHLIRPLLFATREMIADYAAANGIAYRDDASNATDDYLRNAIRHNIVPAIGQWFPGAVVNINESIDRFRDAWLLYRQAVELKRRKLVAQRGSDFYIPVLRLRREEALASLLYEILVPYGFSPGQTQQALALLDAESGHYVQSPTHRVIRNRDFLIITSIPPEVADFVLVEAAPCTVVAGKHCFAFSVQDKPAVIPASKTEAWFDLCDIQFPLVLRRWRQGDYLYPLGMRLKKKKVSRLLIDEKVPLHEKEDIRILESAKRILWVAGMRMDERFKVTESTTKALKVTMTGR